MIKYVITKQIGDDVLIESFESMHDTIALAIRHIRETYDTNMPFMVDGSDDPENTNVVLYSEFVDLRFRIFSINCFDRGDCFTDDVLVNMITNQVMAVIYDTNMRNLRLFHGKSEVHARQYIQTMIDECKEE